MKVQMFPQRQIRRGETPKVGNVYQNPHGKPFYKIVVGINEKRWNGVVMVHVDAKGNVVGCSNQPHGYVKDHHDLMGHVKDFPTMKVELVHE